MGKAIRFWIGDFGFWIAERRRLYPAIQDPKSKWHACFVRVSAIQNPKSKIQNRYVHSQKARSSL
jgi:hypothetical protein